VATLRNLQASPDLALAAARLWRAFHPPLRPSDVVDALRNVALFAGFGAVWLASSGTRRLRRAVLRATVAGVLLSAAVETAQLFSPTRMASVLDVFTNGAGAWLGAAGVAAVIAALARARRPVRLAPVPLAAVAVPYAAACAVEAFSPFGRVDHLPNAWGGPTARLAVAVAEFRAAPWELPPLSDAVLFAPAGALVALWLTERGTPPIRAAALAALGAAPVWALAQLARGMAGGDVRPLATCIQALASTAGALAVAAAVERGAGARLRAWLARWGTAALAGLALAWSLRPFAPEPSLDAAAAKLAHVDLRPLAALFQRYDVYGVADVAVDFLLYAPLGAWLAARARGAEAAGLGRRWGAWAGLLAAVGSELAQAGVRGRTVDVTDALVQGGGVLIGWAAVRRAARRRAERGGEAEAPAPAAAAAPSGGQSALGYVSGGSPSADSHAAGSSSGTTARVRSTW
jgi:VanZ family protein